MFLIMIMLILIGLAKETAAISFSEPALLVISMNGAVEVAEAALLWAVAAVNVGLI